MTDRVRKDPLTGLEIEFIPAEGEPLPGGIGPASSNRVPQELAEVYDYAVETGRLEAAAWISARTTDAIPNSAANPYDAPPQPTEESRDRLDAAEQHYVDDDEDYALDRFIATVFRIGWEQGHATPHATRNVVAVPEKLAQRIRLALDHAYRDARQHEDSYHALAQDLLDCEGYPLDKEPWFDG